MTIQSDLTPAWASGPYSIKRHGCTITQCDSEPVQTPGCIQSHGVLLVLRPADLTIVQISENCDRWLGQPPEHWLNRPVSALLGETFTHRILSLLETERLQNCPIHAFTWPGNGQNTALDVALHLSDDVLLLEMEAIEKPEEQHTDYYQSLQKSIFRLQTAESMDLFCHTVAEEVRQLTGLDRVMVYRFHPDLHGEVVAENKREDLTSWLGLHYPAEDIPKQARDIFEHIWIRPVPDVFEPLCEMVPLANPDTGKPLNMTYCALRGASVMYTEYLQNMGVAASLTLSIRREGKLWGLVACHHYGPKRLPYQIRAACEFLAQVVSVLIVSVEQRQTLEYRLRLQELHSRLITLAAQRGNLEVMLQNSPSLLEGISASGVAIFNNGQWLVKGITPSLPELQALVSWISSLPNWRSSLQPIFHTDSLAQAYPAAKAYADCASGVLAIGLSQYSPQMLLWFRPETIQTIPWAGNPEDKPTRIGPHGPRLCPRSSFEIFKESVRYRSTPWLEVEILAAGELRFNIMQLVVSKAERLAELNAELLRSNQELDTFAYVASHDLKEPLRGISKYLHQLLETTQEANEEQKLKLERMAVLTHRMDSLLESLLNFSRIGRSQMKMDVHDLNEIVDEALEMVSARREENQAEITIPRKLPSLHCDRVRTREIFCNLISNALKYNDKPLKRIEIGYLEPEEAIQAPPRLPEVCATQPVLYVRDNGIGIHDRHHHQVFKMFKRLHGRDEFGGGNGAGLAIVQMLVERHNGRVWLESSVGRGSTFFFTLTSQESGPGR